VILDSMSGLPPLKAATTLAPGTWSLAAGLLRISVKAVAWDVSRPMRPIFRSAAWTREVMANTKVAGTKARGNLMEALLAVFF
jgi:hypothetical protein